MSGTLHDFAYPLNGTVTTPTLANNVNMETGSQLPGVNVPLPPVGITSYGFAFNRRRAARQYDHVHA